MSSRYSISTNRMEYDAEVAYVLATSPRREDEQKAEEDEFEFSLSEQRLRESLRELKEEEEEEEEEEDVAGRDESKSRGGGKGGADGDGGGGKETEIEKRRKQVSFSDLKESHDEARFAREPKEKEIEETDNTADLGEATTDAHAQAPQQKLVVVYGRTTYANRQLVNRLVHSNPSLFSLVVPHTSRTRRKNEISGLDFHFLDRREMAGMIKNGDFLECVKISSPSTKRRFLRPTSHAHLEQSSSANAIASSTSTSSSSPLAQRALRTVVQVPSPLLTPRSEGAIRTRADTNNTSELFGTSREALRRAREQEKPCTVLNVTCKGAEQLRKAGYDGLFILLDQNERETEDQPDSAGRETAASTADQVRPDHIISTDDVNRAFSALQRYTFQAVSSLPLSPRSKLDATRDEWETLPTVPMTPDSQPSTATPFSQQRVLTFSDLLVHFQRAMVGRKPEKKKKTKKLSGLSKHLTSEWKLVLTLSQTELSESDPILLDGLKTLYLRLMGTSLNCRRYGPHWKDLGFQSVDPADDLQEVGFLGIMQLIYALDNPVTLTLMQEIFSYSREGKNRFPFVAVSLNLSHIAFTCLRNGSLTKLCNKRDQVFITLNDFFVALFQKFYRQWKLHTSTSPQLAPTLREIEAFAKRRPKTIISELYSYLDTGKDDREKLLVRRISHSLSNPFTPFNEMEELETSHTHFVTEGEGEGEGEVEEERGRHMDSHSNSFSSLN